MINKEYLKKKLMEYFDVGNPGCTAYNCTRDRSAFGYGTISIDDFEEFNEDNIDDIVNFLTKQDYEYDLIKKIEVIRCFKSNLDGKYYGDFFVETSEGSYYAFINADRLMLISHIQGNHDIGVCTNSPTKKFNDEFFSKLQKMGGIDND